MLAVGKADDSRVDEIIDHDVNVQSESHENSNSGFLILHVLHV